MEREIVGLLERNGVETWYSTADIKSSVQWERTILHGLETSDWFLLVMSPRATKSEWVKDEVHWAVDELPDRLIPVIMEDCNPREFHIRLARIQDVDFRNELEKASEELLSTLRGR